MTTAVVCEFRDRINYLRNLGLDSGLTKEEIDEIIRSALEDLENVAPPHPSYGRSVLNYLWRVLKLALVFIVVVIGLYCLLTCHNPTQRFVTRHTQGLIYPAMQTVRTLFLPVINYFPSLTDWHDESCLVQNPFYTVPNVYCALCSNVKSVPRMSKLQNFTKYYHQNGIPFILTDAMKEPVSFTKLKNLYSSKSEEFDVGAPRLSSTNVTLSTAKSLFTNCSEEELINRAIATRVIRELFPRPYFIPKDTEVSVQRYLFIDSRNADDYNLPLVEFANVWVAQGSGKTHVVLEPYKKCQQLCSTVAVTLSSKEICMSA